MYIIFCQIINARDILFNRVVGQNGRGENDDTPENEALE